MIDGVGQQLRQRREARGQTLEVVSRATRLSRSVLIALEEGRFEDVGAKVYLRGHLRAYANFLELDSDALVEQVEAQLARATVTFDLPAPSSVPRLAVPAYFRTEERPARQMTPATAVMLAATAMIVLVFVWSVRRKKQVQLAAVPAAVTAPALTTPAPAAVDSAAAPVAPPAVPGLQETATEMATGPQAPVRGKKLLLPPLPGREETRPLAR